MWSKIAWTIARTMVVTIGLGVIDARLAPGESAESLRLADVVEEARLRNPEIRAARERSRAIAAIPARVAAYDDPVFSYEAWNVPESVKIERADNNILKL